MREDYLRFCIYTILQFSVNPSHFSEVRVLVAQRYQLSYLGDVCHHLMKAGF